MTHALDAPPSDLTHQDTLRYHTDPELDTHRTDPDTVRYAGGISAWLRDVARVGLAFAPTAQTARKALLVSSEGLTDIPQGGRREVYLVGEGPATVDDPNGSLFNGRQRNRVRTDRRPRQGRLGWSGAGPLPARDMVVAFYSAPDATGRRNEHGSLARWISLQS